MPMLGINLQGLMLGSSRPVLGDWVRLTYIENPGMAFGIDIGGKWFFSIFSIIASVAIALYLYKARNESIAFRAALALILGGAIGNWIDRLRFGWVVDFIDFRIWPVFNVADSAITIGVCLYFMMMMRKS